MEKNQKYVDEHVAQLGKVLLSMHVALGSIPSTIYNSINVCLCNPSTLEIEAEIRSSRSYGHLQLHNEFQARLRETMYINWFSDDFVCCCVCSSA